MVESPVQGKTEKTLSYLPKEENILPIDAEEQEQLKLPEKNELPWAQIRAVNEEKKSQLSFDQPLPKETEEEKPFWEVDEKAGSPVKPVKLKESGNKENPFWEESQDSISWEEPENIIKDFNTIKGQ